MNENESNCIRKIRTTGTSSAQRGKKAMKETLNN